MQEEINKIKLDIKRIRILILINSFTMLFIAMSIIIGQVKRTSYVRENNELIKKDIQIIERYIEEVENE